MKLRKCENGHFYDEEKYAFCPHCKKESLGEDVDFTISMSSGFAPEDEEKTEPLTDIGPIQNLQKEIKQVQKEQDLTVGYYTDKIGIEPVVGWLVCVHGEQKGKSFELHAGRNFIGRGRDMDIVLEKDMAVSRNKHAILIYEARSKIFLAQAGESRELFYINDEVVLSNVKLKAYDELLIGNTKLLFVPFSGDSFTWDEEDKAQ